MDQLSYSDENERMEKLITEFDKPEHQQRLANLNLAELYISLKERNEAFVSLYFQQTSANAELRMQPTASGLRESLVMALRNYLNVVTAMRTMPGWDVLYSELNELVKTANRSVGNSSATGTDEPTDEPTQ